MGWYLARSSSIIRFGPNHIFTKMSQKFDQNLKDLKS